jgi:hypothetical protein
LGGKKSRKKGSKTLLLEIRNFRNGPNRAVCQSIGLSVSRRLRGGVDVGQQRKERQATKSDRINQRPRLITFSGRDRADEKLRGHPPNPSTFPLLTLLVSAAIVSRSSRVLFGHYFAKNGRSELCRVDRPVMERTARRVQVLRKRRNAGMRFYLLAECANNGRSAKGKFLPLFIY